MSHSHAFREHVTLACFDAFDLPNLWDWFLVACYETLHPTMSVHRLVPLSLFSRGHATLHLGLSVRRLVGLSVGHIFEFRAVFALLLLPNRPRLDCRVSGLVQPRVTCSIYSVLFCLPYATLANAKSCLFVCLLLMLFFSPLPPSLQGKGTIKIRRSED